VHKGLTRMTMPQSSMVKELELELHWSPEEDAMMTWRDTCH